jgi:hypothetical protein
MKAFWGVIIGVAAIIAVCLVGNWMLTRHAQEGKTQADLKTEVQRIIDDLKVPPEAIYCDPALMEKVSRIRADAYAAHGVKDFVPYANQARPGTIGDAAAAPNHVTRNHIHGEPFDWQQLWSFSYEYYWLNQTPYRCRELQVALENHYPLGEYLISHKQDVYEKEIHWRLVLLLDSWDDYMGMPACGALVAAGDRSDKLKERLQQIAKRMDYTGNRDEAKRLLTRCGFEVPSTLPATVPSPSSATAPVR